MNNNLVPEARVNKNGVSVIKHVRPDQPESSSARAMPVPTISAPPVVVETVVEQTDYDAILEKNKAFEDRTQSVLLSPEDLGTFSSLLLLAAKTDDDGDSNIWATSQMIHYGDIGGAKTVLAYIEEHEPDEEHHKHVFNTYRYGYHAGIIERGKDYTAEPNGQHYFNFITQLFANTEYDHPVTEVSNEDMQEVASIYHALNGEVDAEELAEYWEERGELEGFLDYSKEHRAIRAGTL